MRKRSFVSLAFAAMAAGAGIAYFNSAPAPNRVATTQSDVDTNNTTPEIPARDVRVIEGVPAYITREGGNGISANGGEIQTPAVVTRDAVPETTPDVVRPTVSGTVLDTTNNAPANPNLVGPFNPAILHTFELLTSALINNQTNPQVRVAIQNAATSMVNDVHNAASYANGGADYRSVTRVSMDFPDTRYVVCMMGGLVQKYQGIQGFDAAKAAIRGTNPQVDAHVAELLVMGAQYRPSNTQQLDITQACAMNSPYYSPRQ